MRKVTLIPGDGIGPEIAASVKEVFAKAGAPVEWEEMNAGLDVFHRTGELLPPELLKSIERNGIALKGPTTTPVGGGHRSINVLMRLHFDLYANVRPVCSFKGLKSVYPDVDMIIVRENSEDLYKGIEYLVTPDTALGIKVITSQASKRIGRHAFELARKLGRKKVTALHKANIMKITDGLFLNCIRSVADEFPDIKFDDMMVDNACMQLVTKPRQFDIIVTENLYGDMISDLGSGLIGGLGVAAGANIGNGRAIFEAVHGSAPDIAGKGVANPTALLLSSIMLLEYMDEGQTAGKIQQALHRTLEDPVTHTRDIGGVLSTQEFTNAVVRNL